MIDPPRMLALFISALESWRDAHNACLPLDYPNRPDPKTWSAAIMSAGCSHLVRAQHLRPVRVGPRHRVLAPACLRSRPDGCGAGWSDVSEAAAGAVGLYPDAMAQIVAAWMRSCATSTADLPEPDLPWVLACQARGDIVADERDALWRLRTGDGKVYDALPWRETARMAEADGALARVSLAEEATLVACATRLKRDGSP